MQAKIAAAAIAAFFGGAVVAHASDLYGITPASSSFTGAGQASATGTGGSFNCSISLTGTTAKSVGMITGVTFSGASGCSSVMAMGLPWKMRALSYTSLQFTHATFMSPGLHCGPTHVKGILTQGGNISIIGHMPSSGGACSVNVTFTTSPALSIDAAN